MGTRTGLGLLISVGLLTGCASAPGTDATPGASPVSGSGSTTRAGATTSDSAPTPTLPATATSVPGAVDYLALGDSLAAGFQVTTGDNPAGAYPAYVGKALGLEVDNLACSGETTATIIEGGRCRYPAGSQLQQAEALLTQHPGISLVTIDIGGNDILGCQRAGDLATQQACVDRGAAAYRKNLPVIFHRLRAAAGEHTRIVALDYYDPTGPTAQRGGTEQARLNAAAVKALDAAITTAADAAGARVARVSADFAARTGDPAPICQLTWVCAIGDVHLSDAGQRAVADVVLATLDES